MKPVYILSFIGLACLLSCNKPTPETAITVIIDRTDTMTRYPTAGEIVIPFAQQDLWQTIHITLTSISDEDINDTHVFMLPPENQLMSNTAIRQARITHFIEQVQQTLGTMHAGTCQHSIIYRTVATQANELAALPASHKVLIVCSDLLEHDSISFYNPHTLAVLKEKPDSIIHIFTRQQRLADLSGVDTYLLYNPHNYNDNNTFMPIARFYQRLLEAHGTTVHISNSFIPQ